MAQYYGPPLTGLHRGSLRKLLAGKTSNHPVLQVLDVKEIGSAATRGDADEFFRIMLSDGEHCHQALLAKQFNELVKNNELRKFSVVQVNECICKTAQNRKILIVFRMQVVGMHGETLGAPTSLDANLQSSQPSAGASRRSQPLDVSKAPLSASELAAATAAADAAAAKLLAEEEAEEAAKAPASIAQGSSQRRRRKKHGGGASAEPDELDTATLAATVPPVAVAGSGASAEPDELDAPRRSESQKRAVAEARLLGPVSGEAVNEVIVESELVWIGSRKAKACCLTFTADRAKLWAAFSDEDELTYDIPLSMVHRVGVSFSLQAADAWPAGWRGLLVLDVKHLMESKLSGYFNLDSHDPQESCFCCLMLENNHLVTINRGILGIIPWHEKWQRISAEEHDDLTVGRGLDAATLVATMPQVAVAGSGTSAEPSASAKRRQRRIAAKAASHHPPAARPTSPVAAPSPEPALSDADEQAQPEAPEEPLEPAPVEMPQPPAPILAAEPVIEDEALCLRRQLEALQLEKNALQLEKNEMEREKKAAESERESQLCSVCLDAPRSHVMIPCFHHCLCGSLECLRMLGTPPLCPICRSAVAQTRQIY